MVPAGIEKFGPFKSPASKIFAMNYLKKQSFENDS